MPIKDNNRVGTFRLNWNYLEKWEELLPLMGNFVVLRAETHFATRDLLITALSPLFDAVPEWIHPPEYDLVVNINEFAPATIIATRITKSDQANNAT